MKPYFVRATDASVEAWAGYRIQFEGMERDIWQKGFKAELKDALSRLPITRDSSFAGFYNPDPRASDVENSLFTNVLEAMPRGVTLLRFERGAADPPAPPIPVELTGGHLHYYRYSVGGRWSTWEPDQTLASWGCLPRRLSDDGSARPVWFALRDANADNLVSIEGAELTPHMGFGLRLTVHATRRGPRDAISYSERLVDGTIAAFHNDRQSDTLLAALGPKFPGVGDKALRRALDTPAGPLFPTPAIRMRGDFVQITPADERCLVGELTIHRDSSSRWPELSGELFTVRPTNTTKHSPALDQTSGQMA